MTPALSENTLTHQSCLPACLRISCVAAKIVSREHVVEMALAVGIAIMDPAGERLVAAMLAPGLGDGFQFHVARIAVERAEMGLDRLHFDQREVELAFAAETHQGGVVHRADGHGHEAELVGRADLQAVETQRPDDHLLDGVVGQHFRAQQGELFVGQAGRPGIS